jgi:transposase
MSERTTRFLGLDVHKATVAVAVAEEAGPPTLYGTVANDPGAVRKLVNQLSRGARLVAAYEAGPTGYTLHRQLTSLGVECQVVAPSLVPRRAGDRVKTDSRDALALARLLRNGDLTPVWVPDSEHEACATWSGHAMTPRSTSSAPAIGLPSSSFDTASIHPKASSTGPFATRPGSAS